MCECPPYYKYISDQVYRIQETIRVYCCSRNSLECLNLCIVEVNINTNVTSEAQTAVTEVYGLLVSNSEPDGSVEHIISIFRVEE
jgi:hypothetical protein